MPFTYAKGAEQKDSHKQIKEQILGKYKLIISGLGLYVSLYLIPSSQSIPRFIQQQCMQQVTRSIRQKHKRDQLRSKIQQLTPQEYFNNVHYHSNPISPHKILAHQFQHIPNYSYDHKQAITNWKMYSLAEAMIYEPLRQNQLNAQYQKSISLRHGNEFLNNFNEQQHTQRKNHYYQKLKAIERLKRQQEEERERQRQRQREKRKKAKSVVLPPIKPKKPFKPSRLRSAFIAIYFMCFLQKRLLRYIEVRRRFCFKNHKILLQKTIQTTKRYYYDKLQREITRYILLLQKKLKYPVINLDKDIIKLIFSFSEKINSLQVPKTVLHALDILSCNYSFFPVAFFFNDEIYRLDFSQDFHCLVDVDSEQSCMITAVFLLIKVLCYNLFYRPWLIQSLFVKKKEKQASLIQNYQDLKSTINKVGSIFYFITIDNFINPNQIIYQSSQQFQEMMEECKLEVVPFLPVAPTTHSYDYGGNFSDEESASEAEQQKLTQIGREQDEEEQQSELGKKQEYQDKTNMIIGQNRSYYMKMKGRYSEEMDAIQKNVVEWVTKINWAVLDNQEKERQLRVRDLYE